MNKSAPPLFSPIQIAQQETAQHVGDIVARGPEKVSGPDNGDIATVLPPVEASPAAAVAENGADDAALMSEWSIRFNGRQYVYCGYHYGRLVDALGYARLMHARQSPEQGGEAWAVNEELEPPGAADRQLMAAHSISFRAGVYEFSGYHYDHLKDALNYARLTERAQGSQERT